MYFVWPPTRIRHFTSVFLTGVGINLNQPDVFKFCINIRRVDNIRKRAQLSTET